MNHQQTVVDLFDWGKLYINGEKKDVSDMVWNENPNATGVRLKHIVTSAQTDGLFSYHLVNIVAGQKIPKHIHETQLETHEVIAGSGICYCDGGQRLYMPGIVSILFPGQAHEVVAGEEGLYLAAKFMPALC